MSEMRSRACAHRVRSGRTRRFARIGSGDRGVLQQLRRALADLYRGARGSFSGPVPTRMITHGNAKTA